MNNRAQVLALAETMRDRISEGDVGYSTNELLDDLREMIRLLNEE